MGPFLATRILLHLAEHFDIHMPQDNAWRVINDYDDKLKWESGVGL
jgi:hypothetical protein